jgi:tRNA (mo5U34)-methyltransferase
VQPLAEKIDQAEARRRIADYALWYHTIDVAPGVTTPGGFDLRHALDFLPWPDVSGKRCLDVGTFDGFFAFELERRGAAEVIGIDIPDANDCDWPVDVRPGVPGAARSLASAGPPRGDGFRLIAELTGSRAEWRALNVYDLDPADIGTFDVVVCGSLLLHLRDPIRAVEAIRGVCDGYLLSSEQIDAWLTVLRPRAPLARFNGSGHDCQWWVPSAAGHEGMLWAAGFAVEERSRPYIERLNPVHGLPAPIRTARREYLARLLLGELDPGEFLRGALHARVLRFMTGDRHPGVLHEALLARPRL